MLAVAAVSALRRSNKDDERRQQQEEEEGEEETRMENNYFSSSSNIIGNGGAHQQQDDDFLLESINFDDLFAGIDDVLPDLQMDPADLFAAADFSSLTSEPDDDDNHHHNNNNNNCSNNNNKSNSGISSKPPDDGGSNNKSSAASSSSSSSDSDSGANSRSISKGDEIVVMRSKRDDDESLLLNPSPSHNSNNNKESEKLGRNSSSKNPPQAKKKVKKVDWTPELHRRFVQAVEQLGVDKAVPSRILEVMGIHCLTRHNIASHLQKYRSHRKHLLAREAEAASWSQRRQMLGGGGGKRDQGSPWVAATIGFPPPMTPMPMPMPHFRPLHVWGHPTSPMDQSLFHIWPKPSPWAPPPPPSQPPPNSDPSFWHHHRGPNALTPGAPCFQQPPLTTTRFGSPTPTTTVAALAMYKVEPGVALPARQPAPRPLFDFHPSKESVDAAIGDVLSKPWLPLPLGLKAPAVESVMGELQRQGIPKVPPSCA